MSRIIIEKGIAKVKKYLILGFLGLVTTTITTTIMLLVTAI